MLVYRKDGDIMDDKLHELNLLETQIQSKISELRSKGYTDDEISEYLNCDETYKKFEEVMDQILDSL